MRERLTRYKDPVEPGDALFAIEIAAITERWFAEHRRELAGRYGEPEASVVVPPTERPSPMHPFVTALDALPASSVPPRVDVLAKGPGTVDRRRPARDAFVADPSVAGRTFLLLDDVYTTGATAQSAAHAIRVAGGHVPVIVVVGRRLNPDTYPPVTELFARQRARNYRFDRSPWDTGDA